MKYQTVPKPPPNRTLKEPPFPKWFLALMAGTFVSMIITGFCID